MAHGVPVVASLLNGGLKEVIASEEYGYITDQHNLDVSAAQVLHLLNSRESARRIGTAGRLHIGRMSDPESIVVKHEELLGI